MNWPTAVAYCDALSWGGRDDWRLPAIEDLSTIIDAGRYNPAIDRTAFPATPNNYFRSSSSYAGGASVAWGVDFGSGFVDNSGKTDAYYVRCVRRGP